MSLYHTHPHTPIYIYIERERDTHTHEGESQVLQYIGNGMHNQPAADIFIEIVNLILSSVLEHDKLAWYPLSTTHWICLYGLEQSLWIYGFIPIWHSFTVLWLTALSPFAHQIHFCCFHGVITQFELVKHKSSSWSCRAGSMDIPDPLSPLFPIVHRLRQVFWTTSGILT